MDVRAILMMWNQMLNTDIKEKQGSEKTVRLLSEKGTEI